MPKKLSNWFIKISTTWFVILSLVIFLLFIIIILPRQTEKIETQNRGARSPDTSIWYSAADLYTMADAYGQAGRNDFIFSHATFDVAWPIVYTLFLVTSLSWLSVRAYPQDSRFRVVNLVPLLAVLFDFLENITTSLVMLRYPANTPLIDSLAGVFTFIKWFLVVASILLLLLTLVMAVWRRGRINY